MLESIRSRLLLWYTLVLALLIASYAGLVTYAYWTSLLTGIDAEIRSVSTVLRQSMTADESGTFDLNFPSQFRETNFGPAAGDAYYGIWNGRGELIDKSEFAMLPSAMPAIGAVTRNGAREVTEPGVEGSRVLIGRPLRASYAAARALGLRIAAAGALLMVLSFAGGSFIAGRALAPVERISRTATQMAAGDLAARIPVRDTDSELEQLAHVLNTTFERLHAMVDEQRRFSADASHEFRTPLAVLRAEVEWSLRRPRSEEEYRVTLLKVQQAAERLTDIANRLLVLGRGETPQPARDTRVDLAALVQDSVDLLKPLAQEHDVTMEAEVQPVMVQGDRSLLADAVMNLLINAIAYNKAGGRVRVQLTSAGNEAALDVEHLPHIFDRFYRVDKSRARAVGGSGLGLAIVKAAVEHHGGRVTCTSQRGEGSRFTVRLPTA